MKRNPAPVVAVILLLLQTVPVTAIVLGDTGPPGLSFGNGVAGLRICENPMYGSDAFSHPVTSATILAVMVPVAAVRNYLPLSPFRRFIFQSQTF